jgi:hypothetical protein
VSSAQTVDLLFDAPDEKSITDLVERLQPELGVGAELVVGRGPDITVELPAPPRYIVAAAAAAPGVDSATMRKRLEDALARLAVRFDTGAIAKTLELTVVFL